jgi:hypothetical protein
MSDRLVNVGIGKSQPRKNVARDPFPEIHVAIEPTSRE